MSVLQAVILGAVQGATEFLPISSSGHLIIIPKILGMAEQSSVFDTTMHLATASALIIYFYKDIKDLIYGFIADFIREKLTFRKYSDTGRYASFIILGSIPAGFIGFLFEDYFERHFRGVIAVSVFLLLGSFFMLLAQQLSLRIKSPHKLNYRRSLLIGLFQSLALFPGISRSGATISGGLLSGLSMESSTRFSFFLSMPVIIFAGIYKLLTSGNALLAADMGAVVAGFLASLTVGILVIGFMMRYLRNNNLNIFIVYRLVLAGVLMMLYLG